MDQLRKWFRSNTFPDTVPELRITDTRKFLNSHFAVLKGNAKDKFKILHQERLLELKKHLENEKQNTEHGIV